MYVTTAEGKYANAARRYVSESYRFSPLCYVFLLCFNTMLGRTLKVKAFLCRTSTPIAPLSRSPKFMEYTGRICH